MKIKNFGIRIIFHRDKRVLSDESPCTQKLYCVVRSEHADSAAAVRCPPRHSFSSLCLLLRVLVRLPTTRATASSSVVCPALKTSFFVRAIFTYCAGCCRVDDAIEAADVARFSTRFPSVRRFKKNL